MKQIIYSDHVHGYFDSIVGYFDNNKQVTYEHHNPMLAGNRGEECIWLPPSVGQGAISRFKVRQGLEIIMSDITLEEDWFQQIYEDHIFEINYCLSGAIDSSVNGISYMPPKKTVNMYVAENCEVQLLKRAKQRYKYIEIRSEPQYILQYFEGLQLHADDDVIKRWLSSGMSSRTMDILHQSVELQRAISEIMYSPYEGMLKIMHMEAKILDVLLLVLHNQFNRQQLQTSSFSGRLGSNELMKPQDIERLYAAKELVKSRMEQPLSLKELARATELNEFKLKTGFKQLFGMTVFEYIREQRLEKGLQLMQLEHYNIGEAAAAVGYSNPSNFSIAFQKKYGCNPSVYLKRHLDK